MCYACKLLAASVHVLEHLACCRSTGSLQLNACYSTVYTVHSQKGYGNAHKLAGWLYSCHFRCSPQPGAAPDGMHRGWPHIQGLAAYCRSPRSPLLRWYGPPPKLRRADPVQDSFCVMPSYLQNKCAWQGHRQRVRHERQEKSGPGLPGATCRRVQAVLQESIRTNPKQLRQC